LAHVASHATRGNAWLTTMLILGVSLPFQRLYFQVERDRDTALVPDLELVEDLGRAWVPVVVVLP
jgi:hypothetical protein